MQVEHPKSYLLAFVAAICRQAAAPVPFAGKDLDACHAWVKRGTLALKLLQQHGMSAASCEILKGNHFTDLPEALEQRRRLSIMAQLASERIYGEVLQALTASSLSPIVVQKGLWLSRLVYPQPYWRNYADMDLLIPAGGEDAAKNMQIVDESVRALGFRALYSALPNWQSIPNWVDDTVIDCIEYKKDFFNVDVHFNLVPHVFPQRVRMPEVFAATRTIMLDLDAWDRPFMVQILSGYDTVMHLALHAGYHCMESGLRALLDIWLSLHYFREEWDWQEFCERCEQLDTAYLVVGPLTLMRQLMAEKEAIPGFVLQRLDPAGQIVARYSDARFIEHFLLSPATLAENQRHFLPLIVGSGYKRMGRAFWHTMFPSPKRMAARYHLHPRDPRLPYYYVKRPFSLVRRYLPSVLRSLSSD